MHIAHAPLTLAAEVMEAMGEAVGEMMGEAVGEVMGKAMEALAAEEEVQQQEQELPGGEGQQLTDDMGNIDLGAGTAEEAGTAATEHAPEDPHPHQPSPRQAHPEPAAQLKAAPKPPSGHPSPAAAAADAAGGAGLLGPDALTVRRYLDGTVVPVLRKALRELCAQRPADPYQYLADFILANRPT